jgi:hypothetical protein
LSGPIQEPLDARQRLLQAALAYADSDAEDDREYLRRERALLYSAVQLGRRAAAESAPGAAQVEADNQAQEKNHEGWIEQTAPDAKGACRHAEEVSREVDGADARACVGG